MIKYQLDSFRSGLDALGLKLSEEQLQQFLTYYELLTEKNKVMNLTTITDFSEVVNKHFLDSLMFIKAVDDINQIERVMDIGTGAGFPGIPIKIAFPHLKVTLLDSVHKKVCFLQEVIQNIGLHNIEAIHGRAEDLGHDANYRESFDLVVSRAVSALPALTEYCLPFVKVGGCFLSYKAENVMEELTAAKKSIQVLGGVLQCSICLPIPGTEIVRTIVGIKKEKPCGKKYPRKAGVPTKTPIR